VVKKIVNVNPARAAGYDETAVMVAPSADVAERRDYGKSCRQVVHRVGQCHWKPVIEAATRISICLSIGIPVGT
jgi:hypothetical protein